MLLDVHWVIQRWVIPNMVSDCALGGGVLHELINVLRYVYVCTSVTVLTSKMNYLTYLKSLYERFSSSKNEIKIYFPEILIKSFQDFLPPSQTFSWYNVGSEQRAWSWKMRKGTFCKQQERKKTVFIEHIPYAKHCCCCWQYKKKNLFYQLFHGWNNQTGKYYLSLVSF